ncbi:MAG TPA: NADH-ubiquinone oxidoreductase-F iron-sulfur binding region domain-containing protein [Candidatus Omnitrophota bacterium]|nr:NADH-ubiquinone oxidoreductase-F iron-sulfur binding region domain-containing protein [Candidatus Omnitrophota bacterium]
MAEDIKELLKKIKQKAIHENLSKWTASTRINIGMSTCEIAAGSKAVLEVLRKEIGRRKIRDVHIGQKGCVGRCHLEPTVEVFQVGKPPFKYENVDAKKARQIIANHFSRNKNLKNGSETKYDYVSKDSLTDKSRFIFGDLDYFAKQRRIVLRNCGVIDPESIDDYLCVRGYEALAKVLAEYEPGRVIDEVSKSGLRGRGGGGFPTGTKWKFVADQKADVKYVICNADEGDPGAFMDRSTIEGDPFSVIEAMTIGGYAVGANKGIVYIRAEYPLAVERLKIAIRQAEALNLLGDNILGTDFSFRIEIVLGAGAFVCGEETALIHSIQGERGMPRIRPPYPPVKGLWGKPTLINNVETWANIPVILLDGWEAFAAIGTEKSKGTKVFALAGKVKNTGLVEVPMGTTLGEIIFDIGGGIKDDKRFKAAQTGGPSGGCLPVQFLNTPIDYESLVSAGSIMGSGGLIVMDETDCMVDVARFFLDFTQDESCGKCTPCREGTKRMLEILTRIASGQGRDGDIEKLEELGDVIKKTALCGLGQTAPNPVLSTIRYFRNEYEAHIKEKRCPAVVCGELFVSSCQHACPVNVNVPGYVGLIRQGKFQKSLEVILQRNPFPSICGRVCHHPCEANCRRGKLDESVAIMRLKQFAADYCQKFHVKLRTYAGAKKKEKVAIAGSGPAGLSCAYQLAKRGYPVTVFEAEKVPGGMLSLGIPEYRLPQKIVKRDVDRIREAGVTIKTGVAIGKNLTLGDLKKQGYKAVFLGVGAWHEKQMSIPGAELAGVMNSLTFLKTCKTGRIRKQNGIYSVAQGKEQIPITGKRVAVIGGGNAAADVVRTALRLGARQVNIIYRRTKDAMPAFPQEIEEAQKEGVKIHFLLNPTAIRGKGGRVSEIECVRMKQGNFDLSGRRKAVSSDEGIVMPVDIVIMAIGAEPSLSGIATKDFQLNITSQGNVEVDPITLATNVKGVFSGGDAVNGGATVVEAIADGERAAVSIDRFLKGEDMAENRFVIRGMRQEVSYLEPTGEVKVRFRPEPARLPEHQRIKSFKEVEKVYSQKKAVFEADRCLRCDRKEAEAIDAEEVQS